MVMSFKKLAAVFLLLILSAHSGEGQQKKIPVIKDLSDKLLKNYSKYILPTETMKLDVNIETDLIALGEIDELEEKLSSVFWFYFSWTDVSINWDANETNIDWIALSYNDVWTPVLRVANPHVDVSKGQGFDRSSDVVTYNSKGEAFYDEMMTTRTSCDLDMTYYPFDIQHCTVEFIMVGSTNFWIDLQVSFHKTFSEEDANHGSWNLIDQSILTGYGLFHINMMFERKPLFILINILLPLILLALLTPVVFLLPKNSGERVGYAITMLLAISVYMTIVSDNLPKNSQPMPLISIMIFIWYILDAVIVFIVIINTKIHAMTSTTQLPCFCRNFAILTEKMTSCITCKICQPETSVDSSEEKETCLEMSAEESSPKDSVPSDSEDHVTSGKITWKDVSKSIDKWCFVISYLFKITLPIVFLSIAKANSR